jgi:outer membrane protein OmpA-like peptidoglycan-associated protein
MRKLLVSTTALSTALSVAISPLGTMPGFAQVMNDDGSVTAEDGTLLCAPTAEAACDLDAAIRALEAAGGDPAAAALALALAAEEAAAAAAAAEAEAAAAAEAEAAAAAEAEAAAAAEAEAAAAAEAEAAAAAEAEAAAAAEAEAAAAAEAEAAAAAEAEAAAAAEAEAAAAAEAEAAAAAEAEAAAAAEAEAAAAVEAEAAAAAEAEAAAAAEAEAAAAAQAEADAAAQAEADAAAQAEAEAAAAAEAAAVEPVAEEPVAEEPVAEEPVAEEPVAEEPTAEEPVAEEPTAEEPFAEEPTVEEPVAEEPPAEEPVAEVPADAIIDSATGEVVDPAVAAEALAEAEAELAITDEGAVVDPAAGLKTAVADPAVEVVPVDAPDVSETEVESLTELLTADPTAVDPSSLAAAGLVAAAPAADGTVAIVEADPADLVAEVTETITEDTARTSAEEFAAAPVALAEGKKSGLSDLEKAGLLVLGALAVGAIIKNNRAAAATDTTVSTMGPQDSRVVSNTGDRVIVLQPDGTYRVLKDDDTVIRRPGSTVRTETFRDGSTRTIVERADGTQVVTIRDATGRVLRRATYDDLGREIVLIDDLVEEEVVVVRDLPKPRKRIVISSKDDDSALKRELAQLEAEKAGRTFSLRQIRDIPEVRALAATIDVEPVTFASGSAVVAAKEARNLADLGRVMQELLDENPREVFLIEGHTDATGKAALNLALSDRRAESVALALTEYFDIPPENMVVQGYGETELLIDTLENEPRNRRVEVKVITPLMRSAQLR